MQRKTSGILIAAALGLACAAVAQSPTSPTSVGEVARSAGEGAARGAGEGGARSSGQGAPAPATPAAPAGEPAKPPAAKDDGAAPPPPPPPDSSKPSPQRFEPTEKVRPDFDVAFPVDI